MTIFTVIPVETDAANLRRAIEAQPDLDVHSLGDAYLVSFQGTSIELSDRIGATVDNGRISGGIGGVLVSVMGNYYGSAQPHTWEWIHSRMERRAP